MLSAYFIILMIIAGGLFIDLYDIYSNVKQHNLYDILCINETSFNSFMIRKKCYHISNVL